MTEAATKLASPIAFQSLSGNYVITDLFAAERPLSHVELTETLDLLAVIPATANIIAKFASGIADDSLSTMFLANRAPVLIAPAMNDRMWEHPTTQRNVATLQALGCRFVDPAVGELACRSTGKGRLAGKQEIMAAIHAVLTGGDFAGKKVLITASRTEEPIDPIRYLSNRSSGRLGFAMASRAQARGAEVTLVSGPTTLPVPSGVEFVGVTTADQMASAVLRHMRGKDYLIMSAAVADYKPIRTATDKIKDKDMQIKLVRTTDILTQVKKKKPRKLKVVGFSLEVKKGLERGKKKMKEKGMDMVVMCDETVPNAYQASVRIISRTGKSWQFKNMEKSRIADEILNLALEL
jgi:phosphopantothenoylcysteine decarboxylase/phosphopantothenate--cysteine ligase